MHAARTPGSILATILLAAFVGACSSVPPQPNFAPIGQEAASHALRMVGRPYRYGGNTPKGFDCSGLVQYSYAQAGARLPRSTEQLRGRSHPVSRRQLQRGDLVFFDQEGKRASHVGIYIGDDRFVHAPSTGKRVYVGNFNDAYWRRHFADARRPLLY